MKKWFKLFGALSIIFGAFLLFSSQTGLTGAVIGTERAGSIGSILGLVLIIGGVMGVMVNKKERQIGKLEMKLREKEDIKEKIKVLERYYQVGSITPEQFADYFNTFIELKGVIYKPQTKLVLNRIYSLHIKNDEDLVIALYTRILDNNPQYEQNCEMHLGKDASSKHHKEGLKRKLS